MITEDEWVFFCTSTFEGFRKSSIEYTEKMAEFLDNHQYLLNWWYTQDIEKVPEEEARRVWKMVHSPLWKALE